MKKIFLVLGGLCSLTLTGARYVEIPLSQFRREARSQTGGFPFQTVVKESSEPLPKLSRALDDIEEYKEVIEQDSSEDPGIPVPLVKDFSKDSSILVPPVKDFPEDSGIPVFPVKDFSEDPGSPVFPVTNSSEHPGIPVPAVGALMLCAYFATQRYVPSFCQTAETREDRPGLENVCDYYITRGYLTFFCKKDKPAEARVEEGVKTLKEDAEVMDTILQSFTDGGGLYPDIPISLQTTMEGDEAKRDILEFIERMTEETSLSKITRKGPEDKVVEGALAAGTGLALLGSFLNQPKLQPNQNPGYSYQGYPYKVPPYQSYPLQPYPQLVMPPYMIPQYITIPIMQFPQIQLLQNGNNRPSITSPSNLPSKDYDIDPGYDYDSMQNSAGSLDKFFPGFFPGRASEIKGEDIKTTSHGVIDGGESRYHPKFHYLPREPRIPKARGFSYETKKRLKRDISSDLTEEPTVGPDHLEWVPVSAPISSSDSNLPELDLKNPRELGSMNDLYGCFKVLSHYIGNIPYYRCEEEVPYGNINTAQASSDKDSSKWVSIHG